jgi:hypothetical protein
MPAPLIATKHTHTVSYPHVSHDESTVVPITASRSATTKFPKQSEYYFGGYYSMKLLLDALGKATVTYASMVTGYSSGTQMRWS